MWPAYGILHYFVVYVKKKENIFGHKSIFWTNKTTVSWKHRLCGKVTFYDFLPQNRQIGRYF
jgi:hypothetical protein